MLVTTSYGTTATGQTANLYTVTNAQGASFTASDYGATLYSVRVPDAQGNFLDVALAHAGLGGYEKNAPGFGATVGRNANRIAGAGFELNGTTHHLSANEGANNLHSGPFPWFERMWQLSSSDERSVTFGLLSNAGDQGFPGEVSVHVTYTLDDENRLTIYYSAMPTEPTVINLTNHTYWNLEGHAYGSVDAHKLQVDASRYTPTDEALIPTGELRDVADTPFDLREDKVLGDILRAVPGGLDHNFCLDSGVGIAHAARLVAGESGIALDVFTDLPGIQVYTAGGLADMRGKDGAAYGRFAGVALETQYWPDAIHHNDWPQPVFGPTHPFVSTTVFAFSLA